MEKFCFQLRKIQHKISKIKCYFTSNYECCIIFVTIDSIKSLNGCFLKSFLIQTSSRVIFIDYFFNQQNEIVKKKKIRI